MLISIILIFVLGYAAIAFEHSIHVNKTASALITGALCWGIYALWGTDIHHISEELSHHLSETASILFFLLGAMTIVEIIDTHKGFSLITERITTTNPKTLLWIVGILSFVLASVLDTLATAIVMVALLRKWIHDPEQRKLMAGYVVIAANAGGAWSPIGAPTTTMLWIGGQVSTVSVIMATFLPSLMCMILPTFFFMSKVKGPITVSADSKEERPVGARSIFFLGTFGLLFVPIFKTFTHLPPYVGMLLVLGVIWLFSELLHKDKEEEIRHQFSMNHAIARIDTPSILFFLGILLAVAALQSLGILSNLAQWMDVTIGNLDIITTIIGLASAIVDNVPLVAAAKGMYTLEAHPMDASLWHLMSYCAATGGSILIIGSAAGVAVMGMEKIDFMWYVRKISLPALIGYLGGIGVYLLLR